ncbi:MAG: DNA-binding transcriptional regulator Fis [bacterium]
MKTADTFTIQPDDRETDIGRESPHGSLRECVEHAIQNYFHDLDGNSTTDLYQFVLAEVEAPLLEAVLVHAGNNQSKAAEILGLNRGTLRKKLKQYDLL